jgi:hypothetical protein
LEPAAAFGDQCRLGIVGERRDETNGRRVITKAINFLHPARAEERRLERSVVRDFARAVRTGDAELCVQSIETLDERVPWQWPAVMRAVAKSPCASDDFRKRLLGLWVLGGDHIRQEVGNDLVLADGLRAMLPRYTGPSVRLYRGEGAQNRRRRAYGLSWSATAEAARAFASSGMYRTSVGGSVLLETLAPTVAIICAPAALDNRYGEDEYLVDRRRLRTVRVLERYGQLTHDEYRHLVKHDRAPLR